MKFRLDDGYSAPLRANLRDCRCDEDWAQRAPGASVCSCGNAVLDNGPAEADCPAYVDPLYLSRAAGHPLCSARFKEHGRVCIVRCRGTNGPVEWLGVACGGVGASPCPSPLLPLYRAPAIAPNTAPCRARYYAGHAANSQDARILSGLSIGILTREICAFTSALRTHEERGLLALVREVLVYMNSRSTELEAALAPFAARHPGLFRILGDSQNVPIGRALSALVAAASGRYFMLLEHDFQLIEPDTCVVEQLVAGTALLDSGRASVIRFRHRTAPGRPEMGAELFMGREGNAFRLEGGFPRYACLVYPWTASAETVYPDVFQPCNASNRDDNHGAFLCTTSWHCSWSNNPFLILREWWQREYAEVVRNEDTTRDLEGFMDKVHWGVKRWEIALPSMGLFSHVDEGKYGPPGFPWTWETRQQTIPSSARESIYCISPNIS